MIHPFGAAFARRQHGRAGLPQRASAHPVLPRLAQTLNDRPAGEPRPVVSGSCALGSGFAVPDIDDEVDFCKSDWPFGALCSGAAASGARRRSSMLCAPRPAAPASATTHAVTKRCFMAISGSPDADYPPHHRRTTDAPPTEYRRTTNVRGRLKFQSRSPFLQMTRNCLGVAPCPNVSLRHIEAIAAKVSEPNRLAAATPVQIRAGTNASARRRTR